MRPAQLPLCSRTTLRPARLQYSSVDEASLFNPFHPASRRFNVGKRAGGTDGVKTLLGFYIRPSRNLRKGRHVVADQFVEPFRRSRLRLQADRVQRCFASGSERMRTTSRLSFVTIGRETADEVSSPNQ